MKQQQIRLLVVGGNGFIGKHVVIHALRLGWSVTSLSLQFKGETNLSNVNYISADISDNVLLKEKLREGSFEYVINCGGYIDHTPFAKGGGKVFDTHFGGILNLVESLNRENLRSFINIGSSDEY